MSALFTPDFRPQSYWWDASPLPVPDPSETEPLPARVDVAVIGAGYTGLNAAVATARAGASTLVLDAEAAGWGCSTRNGGQVSTSVKPDFATLTRRHGRERAAAILKEGQASLDHVARFVAEEGIDCAFSVCGRFHGARPAGHRIRCSTPVPMRFRRKTCRRSSAPAPITAAWCCRVTPASIRGAITRGFWVLPGGRARASSPIARWKSLSGRAAGFA